MRVKLRVLAPAPKAHINSIRVLTFLVLSICGITACMSKADGQQDIGQTPSAAAQASKQMENNMNQWTEFERLKQLTGSAYQRERDAILQTTPDIKSRLKDYHAHQDWHFRILAQILEGWADHKRLYRQVLAELDAVDVEQESKTVVGISRVWDSFALRAKNEYKHDVLPLCWEALLKYVNVWPEWRLITFLRMVAVLPDGRSVEPVLHFMERTNEPGSIDLAGTVLQLLPAETAKKAVEEHLKIAEEAAKGNPTTEVKTRHLRSVLKNTLERLENP